MRSLSFSYLPLDQWFLALKDHLAVFGDLFSFFSFGHNLGHGAAGI